MSSTSQDPYGTGDERDHSSGSTPPPPPGGDTPTYGSTPSYGSQPAYGSTPPAYGSTPPAYGGSSPYGSTPPAYGGGDYGSQPGYGYGYPKNNLGVWSLVLGLVSFVLSCGLFTGIPAIIVGHKSRRAVAEGQANNPGLATAGIILGWIATILSLLGIIAVVVLVATGAFAEYVSTTTPSTSF